MIFFKQFFQKPEDFFKKLSITDSQWSVLTWNWDIKESEERKQSIELNGPKLSRVIWSNKEVVFIENKKIRAFSHHQSQKLKDLFNLSSHLIMKSSIESHYDFMRKTQEGDLNSETRSLQWIQASFRTLQGALDKVSKNPEMIFTCAFFSGVNPEVGQRVLRLICFNLDINYFMLEDGSLRIVVFDDKDLGQGSAQEPVFHQIIKLTKPLFYDEIIKLLQQVTSVGEIH